MNTRSSSPSRASFGISLPWSKMVGSSGPGLSCFSTRNAPEGPKRRITRVAERPRRSSKDKAQRFYTSGLLTASGHARRELYSDAIPRAIQLLRRGPELTQKPLRHRQGHLALRRDDVVRPRLFQGADLRAVRAARKHQDFRVQLLGDLDTRFRQFSGGGEHEALRGF